MKKSIKLTAGSAEPGQIQEVISQLIRDNPHLERITIETPAGTEVLTRLTPVPEAAPRQQNRPVYPYEMQRKASEFMLPIEDFFNRFVDMYKASHAQPEQQTPAVFHNLFSQEFNAYLKANYAEFARLNSIVASSEYYSPPTTETLLNKAHNRAKDGSENLQIPYEQLLPAQAYHIIIDVCQEPDFPVVDAALVYAAAVTALYVFMEQAKG